ncbi:MAG: iron-sulfur protein [Ruminococcaceae bacterium]|nr:iron-sulfur protein [Oscillospiraceae bacterium]
MKIAVINGSPKGKYSVTLQTALYLEKKFPEHEFSVIHAGQKIRALEKDFSKERDILENSDAIIFSYPVYTFLAPSQLHRFIRLMKEKNIDVKDKYVTQISTSKHFYDITAHKYIEENSLDMSMRYIRGLSADMEDLLTKKGQEEAEKFFERFLWCVKEEVYVSATQINSCYSPVSPTEAEKVSNKKDTKDIVILTDETDEKSNLSAMIKRFQNVFEFKTRVVNIAEFPFSGGCLGCLRCAVSEKCVYKDGFENFLRENIQKADAIVYAFKITDHSMGTQFKMYDDRSFCNGHRTVTVGMPVGYLVSGELSKENNLNCMIEARAETGGNFLAGVATDEINPDKEIDTLAKTLAFALNTKHTAPANFWGVGGMKIFRDLIYQMRGMMKADHKFYKKQGIYDFPHKNKGKTILMYALGALLSNEKILSKMGNRMNEGMLMPYEQLLKKMDTENNKK